MYSINVKLISVVELSIICYHTETERLPTNTSNMNFLVVQQQAFLIIVNFTKICRFTTFK